MSNCKIYRLNNRSVISVPDNWELYKYVSNQYEPNYEELFEDKTGTFMLVGERGSEFMISEGGFNFIMMGDVADIYNIEYNDHLERLIYSYVMTSRKMSPYMRCHGLCDEEIFHRMAFLARYLLAFTRTVNNFDDYYYQQQYPKRVFG